MLVKNVGNVCVDLSEKLWLVDFLVVGKFVSVLLLSIYIYIYSHVLC